MCAISALLPELVDFRGNKFEQLVQQTARFDFGFAAEIDQLSVDPVTRRAPAIFIEQAPAINAEGGVLPEQFVKLGNNRLDERGHRERVVDARLRVADADLERVEKRMEPDVPPDFLRIIDATGLDQQLAVIFVLGKRFERVGNSGARKTLEHFEPITFQAGVCPTQKGELTESA